MKFMGLGGETVKLVQGAKELESEKEKRPGGAANLLRKNC